MSEQETTKLETPSLSRRDFLRTSAVATAALGTGLLSTNFAYAAGSDQIKVGLIGCGGRGSGAAGDNASSSEGVVLHAMGDLFQDRLDNARKQLKGTLGDKYKVTDDRAFTGFDAYHKVLATDVDLVILATPPGFRPIHFQAAVDAGKNIFMEKPVAVDPVGIRKIIMGADQAAQKKLAVVSGTQRRHSPDYVETIKRIQGGAIGDVTGGQCYWNQGGLWSHERGPNETEMEWQIRNWLYFPWLSGDHIVEQHVHNLDVMNWVMGGPPSKCVSMGGRQVRTAPVYGVIFDHFTTDFEYPNGAHVMSMCRQIDGTASNVSEHVIGTKGTSDAHSVIRGETAWRYRGESPNPYVQEHADLIKSIRDGQPLNEGKRIAESTLTAIMARMSAYTGQEVTWDFAMKESKLDLSPKEYKFGDNPVGDVPVPGQTPLV